MTLKAGSKNLYTSKGMRRFTTNPLSDRHVGNLFPAGGALYNSAILLHADDSIADSSVTANSPNVENGVAAYTTGKFSNAFDFTTNWQLNVAGAGERFNPWTQGDGVKYQVDCWVYNTSRTGNIDHNQAPTMLGSFAWYNIGHYWGFGPNNVGKLRFQSWRNGQGYYVRVDSNTDMPVNTWIHCALVMEVNGASTNIKMYQDGVLTANSNVTTNDTYGGITDIPLNAGKYNNTAWQGYLDEVRILIGDPAIWTTAFTPPTAPYS